jgi:hypothetical protein
MIGVPIDRQALMWQAASAGKPGSPARVSYETGRRCNRCRIRMLGVRFSGVSGTGFHLPASGALALRQAIKG